MNSQHKREAEHMQMERTMADSKYDDHWGQATTRLDARREKLQQFLDDEKEQYDLEVKDRQKSRRSRTYSNSTLEQINEKLKEQHTNERKLELEAKLYGNWRHGVADDNLVFESDNEVNAKANWFDKQVNQQLEREKDEVQAKERVLHRQEEQLHKERQHEIQEIRELQDMHMEQLQECQMESFALKDQEQKYREYLEDLDKELDLLDESYAALQLPADFGEANNLTKIKGYMRKRSQIFRNQINLCVSILERCLKSAEKPDALMSLKEKFIKQLDSEMYQLTEIDTMYECEAKYSLQKYEELWKQQSSERYKELKDQLNGEHQSGRILLHDVLRKQNLSDMHTNRLNAIENTSEKLKQLIKEEDSPRYSNQPPRPVSTEHDDQFSPRDEQWSMNSITGSIPELNVSNTNMPALPRESHRGRGFYNHDYDASTDVNHVTNTFSHLNMDVDETRYASKRDSDVVRMGGQLSLQVVTPENVERPKYGHKRVDWN